MKPSIPKRGRRACWFGCECCDMPSAILTCHPSTPCAAVRHFAVQVRRCDSKLELEYRLEGDIETLEIPPVGHPQRADGLWHHTCIEAFIKEFPQTDSVLKTESVLDGGYYEFNFSPSTAWAAYHFTDYRQGMEAADLIESVEIAVRQGAGWLELRAIVNLGGLLLPKQGTLRLGLSAVIKESNGTLSYWAYAHPEDKPDFHHADSFAFLI